MRRYSPVKTVFFATIYSLHHSSVFFFFNDTATTEIYTLSLHDALPISILIATPGCRRVRLAIPGKPRCGRRGFPGIARSEEHTSELQSRPHLVCRLLLEKKKPIRSTPIQLPSPQTGQSPPAIWPQQFST